MLVKLTDSISALIDRCFIFSMGQKIREYRMDNKIQWASVYRGWLLGLCKNECQGSSNAPTKVVV